MTTDGDLNYGAEGLFRLALEAEHPWERLALAVLLRARYDLGAAFGAWLAGNGRFWLYIYDSDIPHIVKLTQQQSVAPGVPCRDCLTPIAALTRRRYCDVCLAKRRQGHHQRYYRRRTGRL